MRERKTYSRFIQNVYGWRDFEKGKIINQLHHCVEQDITSFDTGSFTGEKHIGKTFGTALSESSLSRDEIQLIAKHEEEEREDLYEKVDSLLLTLKTDYLDLLLLDFPAHSSETKQAIAHLFSQGKIKEVGGMDLSRQQLRRCEIPLKTNLTRSPFASSQIIKNPGEIENPSEEILHLVWCDFQIKHTPGRDLIFGDLSKKYKLSLNQLFLVWVLKHPAHLHPIINISDKDEISEAVASKEVKMEPIDWEKINLLLT